jgi:uncharacterized membrane protein YccF (DUF307 family)
MAKGSSHPHVSLVKADAPGHQPGRAGWQCGYRKPGGAPVSPLNIILNVLWILTGGIWMAVGWLLAAVIMAITIIGLPWARAAFNIAIYTFLPFGHVALPRDEVEGREDLGTGPLGVLGNIVWLVLAGWWLALGHLITAIGLAITIIGIPFAWAHLKLADVSLWPVGTIVSAEEAELLRSGARRPWQL